MLEQEPTDNSSMPVKQSKGMNMLMSKVFFDGMSKVEIFGDGNGNLLFLTESYQYSGGSTITNVIFDKEQVSKLLDFIKLYQN